MRYEFERKQSSAALCCERDTCSDAQMARCSDVRVLGCPDAQVLGCPGARMPRCSAAQMPRCLDAQMPGCLDALPAHSVHSVLTKCAVKPHTRSDPTPRIHSHAGTFCAFKNVCIDQIHHYFLKTIKTLTEFAVVLMV